MPRGRAACRSIGDIELFARAARAPVVGITGTNGKSTVTTLLAQMAAARRAARCAPAAISARRRSICSMMRAQLYVLELSSFQLETTAVAVARRRRGAQRDARSPGSLCRPGSYAAAKARIFARCDVAVINLDDPLVAAMVAPGAAAR